ncbi:class I SAM-dependent methyltransferase [Mycobacterium angelicum]|uniref:SAM-dependent methyltransferase n=1 Tax=Mycobacterium angelicum TaxID=470074 RepID=A0A1X0A7F5_MYCAN|nr:class I SAM-dependent methyltransferase [Mycobacterium angelicum]MCV7194998.1 methyltransferase domain-containing protein [Mycobacterium angelicum]ORA25825.1 SAM-dependent methyltransferase [Mycobacterium angelicum]
MDDSSTRPVNHHADHRGFAGPIGLAAAIGMLVGGRRQARLAVELTGVSNADHVVDIGCGPGNAVRAAAGTGARVTGIDPSPMMLRLARTLTRNHTAVAWSQGTAEKLPLPEGSATVAWSVKTVHHWKDVTAGLAEVHRVLADQGRFLVIERQVRPDATGLASHGWTERQARDFAGQCRAAGFDAVHIDKHVHGRSAVWAVQAVRTKPASVRQG